MRLALLSDIHGNPIALDAVLADVAAWGGVDGYWVLGDLVALGYDPAAVLDRLASLPNVRYTRGNTDRYLVTGERPPPAPEQVAGDPSLLGRLVDITAAFAWTLGYVTALGRLALLEHLPLEQRLTLPDGTRLLGVHAAPGTDDGPGINPAQTEAQLAEIVADCEADLVVTGHTHWPMEARAGGVHLVNLGSVSNPLAPDLRAKYALLEASGSGYRIEPRQVEYDRHAVLDAIQRVHHPAAAFLGEFFHGQRQPPWQAG